MRRFSLSALLVFSLVVMGVIAIKTMGGAFTHEPEEMKTGLSPQAHALLTKAYEGLDTNSILDYHTHIVGTGEVPAHTWINPRITNPLNLFGQVPLTIAKYNFSTCPFLSSLCNSLKTESFKAIIMHPEVSLSNLCTK